MEDCFMIHRYIIKLIRVHKYLKKVLKTLEERQNTYVFVGNNMFTRKRFIIERKSIRINEEIDTHEYTYK